MTLSPDAPEMRKLAQEMGVRWVPFRQSEMKDLIAFLYFLQVQDPPGNVRRGRQLFDEKHCSACHALAGQGKRNASDLSRWKQLGSPILWARSDRPVGRRTAQPAVHRGSAPVPLRSDRTLPAPAAVCHDRLGHRRFGSVLRPPLDRRQARSTLHVARLGFALSGADATGAGHLSPPGRKQTGQLAAGMDPGEELPGCG